MTFRWIRPGGAMAALALIVTACGGADQEPLPGARISVLELAETIEPDPRVADLDVILPDMQRNRDWAMSGGVPSHAMGHLSLDPPLEAVWSADIGSGASGRIRLVNPPIVADGRLFAMDTDGRLTAIDAASGDEIWQVLAATPFEDTRPLGGGVAYYDGRLFVTTGFGEMLSLDPANGGLIWRAVASGPIRAAPTVADGRVFAVTVDNQLEAVDAYTGVPAWTHTGILEVAGLLGGASPAAGTGVVVAAYSSGEVFAVRQETGRPLWSDSLAALRQVGALASLSDIRGMPVLDGDTVFAVSHGNRTVAIDLRTGARVWDQEIGGINTPWAAGEFLFMLSNANEVLALTRRGGQIRWVTALPRFDDPEDRSGPIVWSGPVLAGNRLILVSSDGTGVMLSPQTGEPVETFELRDGTEVPPIVADGTLYVLTDDGLVTAYR